MAHLHAVAASDEPSQSPPRRRMTVSQAAERGSHRDLLVAMRTRIAGTVGSVDCPPRDLAALTRRLQEIAREIEHIDRREITEREAEIGDEPFDPTDA